MLGRGKRVGVVQFIKGAWHSAERDALETFGDQVSWHTMGEGFTWDTQDLKRDIAAAGARLGQGARADGRSDAWRCIILDELNIALRYDYLDLHVGHRDARRRGGRTCTSSSPAATPSPSWSPRPISSPT